MMIYDVSNMIYVEWRVLVWFPFIVESSNNVGAGSSQQTTHKPFLDPIEII